MKIVIFMMYLIYFILKNKKRDGYVCYVLGYVDFFLYFKVEYFFMFIYECRRLII